MPVLRFTIEADQQGLSSFKQAAEKAGKVYNQAFKQAQGSSGGMASQTKEIKDQEEALKELRRELRRKISLVDADLRLGNKSQEEAVQSIQKIKQWAEAQGAFNREMLTGAMNLKTFSNAQTRAKNNFTGMSAVTNRANQVLFDLNQGLQDLPFGMRGVGNNIPFVIEGFRRFSKAAREDGISPIKGFMSALASPAGLIGTAAAVIPTLILFAQQFDLFGDSAEEASESVQTIIDKLVNLQGEINDLRGLGGIFDTESLQEELFLLDQVSRQAQKRLSEVQRSLIIESFGLEDPARIDRFFNTLREQGISISQVFSELDLGEKSLQRVNALQALIAEQEKKRLKIQEQITINKDVQALDAVKERKRQKELLELLEQANKLEQELKEKYKDQLDFQVEQLEVSEDKKNREEELAAITERRAKQLSEQEKIERTLFEMRTKFATEQRRFGMQVTQERLANQQNFTDRRIQLEQQLTNELNRIRNNRLLSEVDREKAILEARKNFMQQSLQLERSVAQQRKQIAQQLSQSRIQLQQLTLNALTSLSQAFAEDSKGIAIAILAIEKGLAIAQAAKEGAEKAGRAQMIASFYAAQAFTPLGPNPAAIAAATNAQAQVGAIKATTVATIAAIAATGLGEAAGIALRGNRSQGTPAGGGTAAAPPQGFQTFESDLQRSGTNFSQAGETPQITVNLRTEADSRIISAKAEEGRKRREFKAVTLNSES